MSEVESTTDQTESNDPLWQVQLASGQVCRMTLELLDDAFQDGLINEATLVMQDGTTDWVTLRDLLGLDSEGEGSSDAPVSAEAPVGADSVPTLTEAAPVHAEAAPVASPIETAPAALPVQAIAQPSGYVDPFAPPVQVAQPAPAPVQQPVAPSAPAAFYDPFAPPVAVAKPAPQIVPPASAQANPFGLQAAAAPSYAPPSSNYPGVSEPLTRSTAPVAADVDFDLGDVSFAKKRSPAKWIVGIAAVLGGLGFAAMNMNTAEPTIPPAVAAPAAPPAYESTPTPSTPVEAQPAVVQTKPALSDEAKKALADADKTRAAKMQQQRAAQPSRGGGSAPRAGKSSGPFHKGGDKYDPLNASL